MMRSNGRRECFPLLLFILLLARLHAQFACRHGGIVFHLKKALYLSLFLNSDSPDTEPEAAATTAKATPMNARMERAMVAVSVSCFFFQKRWRKKSQIEKIRDQLPKDDE